MKSSLGGADVTREDVIAAIDYVCPSIEILDTRIVRVDAETGKTRKVFDTISDNAANAGVVLGPQSIKYQPLTCAGLAPLPHETMRWKRRDWALVY